MNKNTKQMNIYNGDKKEEKKFPSSKYEIDTQKSNLHFQLLAKFLHNMAGKINICNFLFEMHANMDDIKKVFAIIEAMFLLYRGILLESSDINIPGNLLVKLVEDKGGKCIIDNFTHFIEEKAFLVIILYNCISNNTIITMTKNFVIIKDNDMQHIIELIDNYTSSVVNTNFQFLSKYIVQENQMFFNFQMQ